MPPCVICKEPVSRWPSFWPSGEPHYKLVHPDYFKWFRRFFIVLLIFDAVLIATLGILNLFVPVADLGNVLARFVPDSPPYHILTLILTFAELVIVIIIYQVKLYRFKLEWRENH